VQITQSGNLYLNDQKININQLAPEIEKRFKNQKSVYLVGDKRGHIDEFVQVIYALSQAHFKVQVVTKLQELPKP
jgi:biopolymer transport protein ExbD